MKSVFLLSTALAGLLAGTATAETISRSELVMAVSACQSALPVFDGVIRKRPLAVQNEGSSSSFITCGLEGVFGATPHSTSIAIGFINHGAAAVTVNCTLVDGRNLLTDPIYLPASSSVPAGGTSSITWSPDGESFIYPAISCNLPPNAGIRYVGRTFNEEIGVR